MIDEWKSLSNGVKWSSIGGGTRSHIERMYFVELSPVAIFRTSHLSFPTNGSHSSSFHPARVEREIGENAKSLPISQKILKNGINLEFD